MSRARHWKRPESVLVVVYTTKGEVLLLKRADRPDFWQSVTGSLKWDETPDAAARRELLEETGIDATPLDSHQTRRFEIVPPWAGRFPPGTRFNVEHAFELALPERRDITFNPGEHSEYAWVEWPQAVAQVGSWTNREALERIAVREGPGD